MLHKESRKLTQSRRKGCIPPHRSRSKMPHMHGGKGEATEAYIQYVEEPPTQPTPQMGVFQRELVEDAGGEVPFSCVGQYNHHVLPLAEFFRHLHRSDECSA